MRTWMTGQKNLDEFEFEKWILDFGMDVQGSLKRR